MSLEFSKIIATTWLKWNWEHSPVLIKLYIIVSVILLVGLSVISSFGFLSKAHLEQGSATIDNSAKIEQLNYQINREKALIADNEKVIGQLDATVNSFLGQDRTSRSLAVRKSQAPQRKQLQNDSAEAQKRIDALSAEKFTLESEVRKVQLEVGPIRYIAELFYGVEENASKNIESAVRIFTLLIVSTLDPLAIILLIAANHTLLRLKNEKEKKETTQESVGPRGDRHAEEDDNLQIKEAPSENAGHPVNYNNEPDQIIEEVEIPVPLQKDSVETVGDGDNEATEPKSVPDNTKQEIKKLDTALTVPPLSTQKPATIRQPQLSRITKSDDDSTPNQTSLKEIVGIIPQHFNPKKADAVVPHVQDDNAVSKKVHKYPKILSWINQFSKEQNG